MKQSLKRWLIPSAMMVLLGLFSTSAMAQCDPEVEARDGTRGNSATYCMNELVPFFTNSPGFDNNVTWDFGGLGTSNQKNPEFAFSQAGTFIVKFTGTGLAGTCNKDLTITIQPSPVIVLRLEVPDSQCFEGNSFCIVDSSYTVSTSYIRRGTHLWGDGERIDTLNASMPWKYCKNIADISGGHFDLIVEHEDANGCVSKTTFKDYVFITPKMGIEFLNKTPAPNPGCDSTLGRFQNISSIDLKDVASFCWIWGDTSKQVCGDSVTNTEWWDGPNGDGIVEHMYRENGTFNGSLTVTSKFGCTETFTWKAAVTNIVINPVIIADKDSSCVADNPVAFKLKDGPVQGASAWLWNFGDPPSGPANFNDKEWNVDHSYGTGPWMISLRIIAGPCDVTVFDTITKIGPGSTIEVPFVRVPEDETYQCYITDSIHFPNNSSFRHNDPFAHDEDSVVFFYSQSVKVKFFPGTGFDSLQHTIYDSDFKPIKTKNYPITGSVSLPGYTVSYDAGKDSLKVVSLSTGTSYEDKNFFGIDRKVRYVFNYPGDQTAIPNADQERGMNPHVWRVWDFGDNYAPQCTTDARPWRNRNVGINCNWSIDSLPVHWYTPWDEVYETINGGNFYKTPAKKTLFNKVQRRCFVVNYYPDSTIIIPGDTVLTIPYGKFYTYQGVTIGVLQGYPKSEFKIGNWIIRRPPAVWVAPYVYTDDSLVYVVNGTDTTKHLKWMVGRDSVLGSLTYTVVKYDMDVQIPSGVTIKVLKLAAAGGGGGGAGATRTETGPKTVTLKKDEQFTLYERDSLFAVITIEENDADTSYAMSSKYVQDDGSEIDSVFIDSAYHRTAFFEENSRCYNVVLWHMDTVHPLACEAEATKSLALIPPNAKGLEIEAGIPCPLDGDNLSYYLTFTMRKTKPGCTQQWFAVNFDSLADPTNFIPYNQGVLAPPPPGSPLPFVLPYMLVGNKGIQFVKGYTPGEIGNDPTLRKPNGSFTIGLIVGNGQPNPNGGPPECLDTAWYHSMFRILYLNADFDIVYPTAPKKAMCAGDTAYFRLRETIQDSITSLRWNWGYQGIGKGVNLAGYSEQFVYYQPYTGPVPGRNDQDVVYNGEKWLYNYVIRSNLSDVTGFETIDTIVTSIMRDWRIVADKSAADDIVFDMFEAKGLYLPDIPADEVALYLGPSDPPYCIDTTGLSQYFAFGIKAYSERVDTNVVRHGRYRYLYTYDANGKRDSTIVAEVLHFRDSSLQGFDSLAIDTNFDGKKDMLRGLYKYVYRHPVIVQDPCDNSKYDTIYVPSNGPMIPNLFLNNTVGCEKRGAALLNVGFLNDFWLDNPNICNGLVVNLHDTLRYWQYGEEDPLTYPIVDYDFWNDPDRYLSNVEYYKVDWDASDGLGVPVWDRSIGQNHIYDKPGTYTITAVSKDSIGCFDTVRIEAKITEVVPDFGVSSSFLNCATIVDFVDSSAINDPCLISDTCKDTKPCEDIVSWEWDFGDGTRKSLLQNPSHDYTQGGWHDVTLITKSKLGCEDTVVKSIYIPGPDPEFEFEYAEWNDRDSAFICVGDSIVLKNISGGDKIAPEWLMLWGDNKTSNPEDGAYFGHRYDSVGVFEISLIQFDEIPGETQRCSRIFPDTNPDLLTQRKIKIYVLPRREASLEIVDTVLCPDEVTDFIAHADTIYDRYTWIMGDGNQYNRNFPDSIIQHSYTAPGKYDIILIPKYVNADQFIPVCPDTAYGSVRVADVFASFSVDSTEKPEFCFNNESVNATSYAWTFQDETLTGDSLIVESTEENPCHNWNDRVGEWEVCLTATSAEGCVDDTCLTIINTFQRKLVVYNVFTPPAVGSGGDGRNDEFVIDGKGLETFNIVIYNRIGEKVFESDDIEVSWNGQINNTGVACPDGTYFYIINYKFLYEEENEGMGPIEGSVDLLRE